MLDLAVIVFMLMPAAKWAQDSEAVLYPLLFRVGPCGWLASRIRHSGFRFPWQSISPAGAVGGSFFVPQQTRAKVPRPSRVSRRTRLMTSKTWLALVIQNHSKLANESSRAIALELSG
jgi:hypothetical protein